MFRLLSAVAATAFGTLVFAQARAADLTLNVKTGLWQTTVSMQTSGQLPIPEADLAKMTPERRQQFEAAMKTAMATASQPHVVNSCVTAEQLRKGLSFNAEENPACKRTVLASSATTWEMREECTGASARSSTVRLHAVSTEEIEGKMQMTMTRGERSMTSDGTLHGKWLKSDCGDVKPGTAERKPPAK